MTITAFQIKTPQDLEAAYRIRKTVFVQEQGVPEEAEYDQHEATAHHYLATANGVPCGAARWRITENGIKLERFAVLPEYRNQAVGSHLLREVLKDTQEAYPAKKLYLHAQLRAVPFYQRHGFTSVGDRFTECDIEHYKMELNG